MKFIKDNIVQDYERETGLTEIEWADYLRTRTYRHAFKHMDDFVDMFDYDLDTIDEINEVFVAEQEEARGRFIELFQKRQLFFERVAAEDPTRFFITPFKFHFEDLRSTVSYFYERRIPLSHIIFNFERDRLHGVSSKAHNLIIFGYDNNLMQLVSDYILHIEPSNQSLQQLTGLTMYEWREYLRALHARKIWHNIWSIIAGHLDIWLRIGANAQIKVINRMIHEFRAKRLAMVLERVSGSKPVEYAKFDPVLYPGFKYETKWFSENRIPLENLLLPNEYEHDDFRPARADNFYTGRAIMDGESNDEIFPFVLPQTMVVLRKLKQQINQLDDPIVIEDDGETVHRGNEELPVLQDVIRAAAEPAIEPIAQFPILISRTHRAFTIFTFMVIAAIGGYLIHRAKNIRKQ